MSGFGSALVGFACLILAVCAGMSMVISALRTKGDSK